MSIASDSIQLILLGSLNSHFACEGVFTCNEIEPDILARNSYIYWAEWVTDPFALKLMNSKLWGLCFNNITYNLTRQPALTL